MSFTELLASFLSREGSIIWEQDNRLHLRLRSPYGADREASRKRTEQALEDLPAVAWARVHARLGCVVVQLESIAADRQRLLAVLEEAERDASTPRVAPHSSRATRHGGGGTLESSQVPATRQAPRGRSPER